MRNLLAALFLFATATATATDAPKFISASAVEPAVGRYLVTFGELALAEPPTALASRLAAQYGARIEPYAREGFQGFMIVATPAKARLLSLDPRIASVVEQAVPGIAAPVVAAPVVMAPVMSSSLQRVATDATTTSTIGTYTYDGSGNISKITGTSGTENYNYDPLSRVTRGDLGSSLWQEYDYDRHGNMTAIRTAAAAARKLAVDTDTNQIDHSSAASTDISGTYDAAGNMKTVQWTTGGLATAFEYDGLNVVTATTIANVRRRHLYTASDERIASIDPTIGERWTIRDANGKVLRRFTRNGTAALQWNEDYVYRGGSMLTAYVTGPEKILHFFPDHLGSPRLITGNGGAKLAEHRYYPFGEEATPRGQDTEARKFTGHERDTAGIAAAADLDYMHARYYGPAFGRFLSVDPGRDWNPGQPQSWNLYAYVRNNPVTFTDPSGRYTAVCPPLSLSCLADAAAFERAREANMASKRAPITTATASFGKTTDQNGVFVFFGNIEAKGETKTTLAANDTNTGFALTANVMIRSGVRSANMNDVVAHEGEHVRGPQAMLASIKYNPTTFDLTFDQSSNFTAYQTEMNAFRVTAAVATWLKVNIGAGNHTFTPGMSPKEVDRVARELLRDPKGGYGLTETNQGKTQTGW